MQPKPNADTSKLFFPSLRVSILFLLNRFFHTQSTSTRLEPGSPILPIYCLFLLSPEKSIVINEAGRLS
jgi:hypothetical protein